MQRNIIYFYISFAFLSGCGGDNSITSQSLEEPENNSSVVASTFVGVKEAETFISDDGREVQAAKDEILVYLEEDVTQEEYDEIIQYIENSGAIITAFDKDLKVLQVQIDPVASELALIAEFETLIGVNTSGLNEVVVLTRFNNNAEGYSNYLSKPQLTNPTKSYGNSTTFTTQATIPSFPGDYWVDHIDVGTAWDIEDRLSSLSKVTIGIVDTGINFKQKILEENRLTRYNQNGLLLVEDEDGTKNNIERNEHGLWTTAFAAGFYDESKAISIDNISRGVSRNSKVVHIEIDETREDYKAFQTALLKGVKTAIQKGADVVNLSWGNSSKCKHDQSQRLAARQAFRKTWSNALAYVKRKDRLLLFSSGNNCEKQDNQLLPTISDIDADPWLTHAVVVGATDSTKTDTLFSRMGNVVNLVAPGKDIGYGESDLFWWAADDTNSGTSFSAPLATGTAAVVKGINGTLSAP
ncbi:MAG: S8/S53 family peptidase [Thiotrichaceae bacterium]|nr:S8/S53 family peptidase [Thiotrichaceae bacterium]